MEPKNYKTDWGIQVVRAFCLIALSFEWGLGKPHAQTAIVGNPMPPVSPGQESLLASGCLLLMESSHCITRFKHKLMKQRRFSL